jgi:hypothetical protein
VPTATDQQSASSWSIRSLAAKLFSFPVMCMTLLAAVVFAYAPLGITIGESDIWWHLLNARNLLQHHSLSGIDTHTFTVAGASWMSFEWLSEIPFYLAFRVAAWQGVLLVYSVVMVLIFAGIYYRSCRAGADCKDAAVATLGAICIGTGSLAPRTLLFGWLCLTTLLLVVDHFRRTGKGLWILPPLFALWINLHGSWVYGMVVLGVTIASGLVQGEWGIVVAQRWKAPELRKLILVTAISFAALFANPFGYKLVLYPLDFLLRQQAIMRGSKYWLSVDFGTTYGHLTLLLLFALFGIALVSSRRWRLDEVLLIAFALYSGLSHMRNLDFTAIIIMPILAPHIKLFPEYQPELDKPWLNAVIMGAVIVGLIHFFPTEQELQAQIDRQYPKAALDFMRTQHSGRIFNSVEFGGYMEWNYPGLKPFIDGRGDIFIYNGIYDDYAGVTGLTRPLEALDKYHIDYVLVERNWPLTYLLENSPGWQLIHSDDVAKVFRHGPPLAVSDDSLAK